MRAFGLLIAFGDTGARATEAATMLRASA